MSKKLIKDLKVGDKIFRCEGDYSAIVMPYDVLKCNKLFGDGTYRLHVSDVYGNINKFNANGEKHFAYDGNCFYYTSLDVIISNLNAKISFLKNAVADVCEMKDKYE